MKRYLGGTARRQHSREPRREQGRHRRPPQIVGGGAQADQRRAEEALGSAP